MTLRVFITGASSGIGEALAKHYARSGAILGLVGRRQAELERVAAACGGTSRTYLADVADVAAMRAAAEDFVAGHGVPDIVIANAGVSIGTLGAVEEDIAVTERLLRTNVVGIAATLQPFIAPMLARKQGTLVTVASVAGYRGLPGAGAYSASKAAVIAWSEALRLELRGTGVRVVTIAPGYIDTPMTQVNTYPMPFLLAADEFAARAARAIEAGTKFIVIPWQMGVLGWLLKRLPRWLYDPILANRGRKPRNLPL